MKFPEKPRLCGNCGWYKPNRCRNGDGICNAPAVWPDKDDLPMSFEIIRTGLVVYPPLRQGVWSKHGAKSCRSWVAKQRKRK